MPIRYDSSLCTGCELCQMWCSFEKLGRFNPRLARIQISAPEHVMTAAICSQCKNPWCIKVCPESALTQKNGIIAVADNCTGCRLCADFCPQGAINTQATPVLICDLCSHSDSTTPPCVVHCPTGALKLVTEVDTR